MLNPIPIVSEFMYKRRFCGRKLLYDHVYVDQPLNGINGRFQNIHLFGRAEGSGLSFFRPLLFLTPSRLRLLGHWSRLAARTAKYARYSAQA